MAVDYDLIVWGATPAGIHAAIAAATLKARVALITQAITPNHAPEAIAQQALIHLANLSNQTHHSPLAFLQSPPPPLKWHWARSQPWLETVVDNVAATRSETVLAYHGVDVITGQAAFCRQPRMGVAVGDRIWQARGYLLAMDARPEIPSIAGLSTVGYLTADQVPAQIGSLAAQQTVVIIGCGPTAVELAQTLTRLGVQATIVTQSSCLLPDCDRDISQFIQAQLEAEGVHLRLQTRIDQLRSQGNQKQLLLDQTLLPVDEIILAVGHSPHVGALNLDAVGVEWNEQGIPVKPTLQTSNPRVYACEGRRGQECSVTAATYEAAIALHNILFFPTRRAQAGHIPGVIQTMPSVAWVGQTADQAVKQYGRRNIYLLRQSLNCLPSAQIRDDLSGFCKLVVHRDGTLLGAHLVGWQASEAIALLALALPQRLNISAIAALPLPASSFAASIQQTALQFRQLQLKRNRWQQDLVDHFFDCRRAWSRPPRQ